MSGRVSLPLKVEIAFDAGPMDASPVWTDVSDHVQRQKTVAVSRSVDVITGEPSGRGAVRFRNDDGDFTPGLEGAFGLVRNRLPIRVKQGSKVLWTGLVERWAIGMEGTRPVVDATLVDRWPRLRKRVLTGDRILSVCQQLAPEDCWPLTDPAGSTRAESLTTSWALKPLSVTHVVNWATADNPVAGVAKVAAVGSSAVTLLKAWDGVGTPSAAAYESGFTVSLWSRIPADGGLVQWDVDNTDTDGLRIDVQRTAITVEADALTMSPAFVANTSSAWRHVALTCDVSGATPVLRLFVDGAQVWTYTALFDPSWEPLRQHVLTLQSVDLAYVCTWDRPLAANEIAGIAAAGTDSLGATGDTADVRAALIASLWPQTVIGMSGTYVGHTLNDDVDLNAPVALNASQRTASDFTATMSKQSLAGVSQADLLLACARAEGGMIWMDRHGWPYLASRTARSSAPLAATIPTSVIQGDSQWELDDTQVVNVCTVERMALNESVTSITRRNEASIALYDEVTRDLQLWLDSDTAAVDRANSEVLINDTSTARSRSFTVDLFTCGASIPVATLLSVDIGSRIKLDNVDARMPTSTISGWYVDGIDDDITEKQWRRTFTVSPAVDFLVLDDDTFGALDTWPLG